MRGKHDPLRWSASALALITPAPPSRFDNGVMQPTESAVLVVVPEAESVVADYRADLDPAAGLGVPAHVTVLYPFVPPERVDDAVISALQRTVRSVAAFDVTFARLRCFDRSVLWLAPEPAERSSRSPPPSGGPFPAMNLMAAKSPMWCRTSPSASTRPTASWSQPRARFSPASRSRRASARPS
jgi:2'-5' RNA ligase superfamily